MPERTDEFYIGYLPQAPPGHAARTRMAVLAALILAAGVALILVTGQGRFGAGVFEFGITKNFQGVVLERPYPMLLLEPDGGEGSFSSYLLVAFGKRGAADLVSGMDGEPVKLQGSLIHREGWAMIEVADGTIEPWTEVDAHRLVGRLAQEAVDLGEHTLRGEVVDIKCYLGVMKPAHGKPHRSCAARCISGGIPPVLMVKDRDGDTNHLLLVSADGRAVNQEVLPLVAEPVEITGRVVRLGDRLVLQANPETYRRLPS